MIAGVVRALAGRAIAPAASTRAWAKREVESLEFMMASSCLEHEGVWSRMGDGPFVAAASHRARRPFRRDRPASPPGVSRIRPGQSEFFVAFADRALAAAERARMYCTL